MVYKVKVNQDTIFEIKATDVSILDAVAVNDSEFHVLYENKSFHTKIVKSDLSTKSYTITINNTPYHISIKDELDVLIDTMGFTLGSKKKINSIKAPMPGLILDIPVMVGQNINEDDALIILEAMKMENVITSPIDGVIKSLGAKKGDAVEKNQLLIEFE